MYYFTKTELVEYNNILIIVVFIVISVKCAGKQIYK